MKLKNKSLVFQKPKIQNNFSANTRYLFVENNRFTANQKRWGTFTIYLGNAYF